MSEEEKKVKESKETENTNEDNESRESATIDIRKYDADPYDDLALIPDKIPVRTKPLKKNRFYYTTAYDILKCIYHRGYPNLNKCVTVSLEVSYFTKHGEMRHTFLKSIDVRYLAVVAHKAFGVCQTLSTAYRMDHPTEENYYIYFIPLAYIMGLLLSCRYNDDLYASMRTMRVFKLRQPLTDMFKASSLFDVAEEVRLTATYDDFEDSNIRVYC